MALTAVYDACVLYSAPLRDLLIRLAEAGLLHARWSDEILDEVFRNLQANRPDLDPENLAVTRQLMCVAVRDCLVAGHMKLVDGLVLPDPDDRHVLAAAIHCKAQVIVTDNIRDFPEETLWRFKIEAMPADDFVLSVAQTAPELVAEIIKSQAGDLVNPPYTVEQLLARLAHNGLQRSVVALRAALAQGGETQRPPR